MKDTPLLMKGPLVISTIEGRKTETRRLRGLDDINTEPDDWRFIGANSLGQFMFVSEGRGEIKRVECPYGLEGDRLWIKETWRTYKSLDHLKPTSILAGAGIEYKAGGSSVHGHDSLLGMGKWRPSIFMRNVFSRVHLQNSMVLVQRLHQITEREANAEGVDPVLLPFDYEILGAKKSYRNGFMVTWDTINSERKGGHPWNKNPWVWVIKFRVISNHT